MRLGLVLADACAVATPLLAPDGSLIAAISAAVDVSHAHRLDDIDEELKSSKIDLSRTFDDRFVRKAAGG